MVVRHDASSLIRFLFPIIFIPVGGSPYVDQLYAWECGIQFFMGRFRVYLSKLLLLQRPPLMPLSNKSQLPTASLDRRRGAVRQHMPQRKLIGMKKMAEFIFEWCPEPMAAGRKARPLHPGSHSLGRCCLFCEICERQLSNPLYKFARPFSLSLSDRY